MNKIYQILCFIPMLFIGTFTMKAQDQLYRNDTIPVFENGKLLKLPWASGINAGQFNEIDVNFDGEKDLFILEGNNRKNEEFFGDKIYVFLKLKDDNGKYYYKYDPSYQSFFPVLDHFAQLRDFNGDGLEDIFTRSYFGNSIDVYINESDVANKKLKFRRFITDLASKGDSLPPTYPFRSVIVQDFVNMTSIEDIDGDGDLDFLVVSNSEVFINYYKNISPTRDTIILQMMNTCWGNALVSNDSIVLNTCDPDGNVKNPERVKKPKPYFPQSGGSKGNKDAGVGLLAIDLDGDGVKDLITGNPTSLRMCHNNGTVTSSNFNTFTYNYPASKPLKDKEYIVVPFYIDVDFDNKKDLVTSVLWDSYQDIESIEFYKNTGTNQIPNFVHQTDNFLTEEMIDVGSFSYPKFFHYDGDSLWDIIIGNDQYYTKASNPNPTGSALAVYRNIGEPWNPKFELVTKDFMNISQMILDTANNKTARALNPTFGDLDGDGDEDMLIGDYRGRLHYFENTAGAGNTVTYAPPIIDYQDIRVGVNGFFNTIGYAAPQLIDIDEDGLLDLIIGERAGTINYFKNTGTASSPQFTLMNDSIGNVIVSEPWDFYDGGRSVPFFYKDSTQEMKLLCGNKQGFFIYYDQILNGNKEFLNNFNLADSSYQNIWHGVFSSIHGADINGDSLMDFITGNISGGTVLYTSTGKRFIPGVGEYDLDNIQTRIYPNPTTNNFRIEIDGIPVNSRVNVTVNDLVGRAIKHEAIYARDIIDVSDLNPGIYILNIRTLNGIPLDSKRLIKK